MRQATSEPSSDRAPTHPPTDPLIEKITTALATPGLVVLHGAPGSGRTTLLTAVAAAWPGPVLTGGALATLQNVPALALTRATRVRLPTGDPHLLAEAVRSRVRTGLLLLDDLHWADPATLAALTPLAAHCRIVTTLRTPHRLPTHATDTLRATARHWLPIPPLDPDTATHLARTTAPALSTDTIADIVRRAGGNPLAIRALAHHTARHPHPTGQPTHHIDHVAHAVAEALADLTRPARTAMAALGLLGHPATTTLLGPGVDELTTTGLVTTDTDTTVTPVSPYTAEIAAGLLDTPTRQALHRHLAAALPAAEAARHLAAAGDTDAAYQRAITAASTATTAGERADLLLLACDLPDTHPTPRIRAAAAHAALTTGRPHAAVTVLRHTDTPLDPDTTALLGEALAQTGDLTAAHHTTATIDDDAPDHLVAARDRIRLLHALATDPTTAATTATTITTRHGTHPHHPGLKAALAATLAATRQPGWEHALATATTTAADAGDHLAARWSAWLLVDTLIADGRLPEAARTATTAADACATDLAYSWQARFLAAALWCDTLHHGGTHPDDIHRRAANLTDRTLPATARAHTAAATSLIEADSGLLAPARARLATTDHTGPGDTLLDWVRRETAWLDGQPDLATTPPTTDTPTLTDGLRRITARWAAHDNATTTHDTDHHPLPVITQTLTAWRHPHTFPDAATTWSHISLREQVRCLLAHGLHTTDPDQAVPTLLTAEQLAEKHGLVVLLGRIRRALRRHAVRRDNRGHRTDGDLTPRERDVLTLVAAGEPTRRIAGQLGISTETVETHVRAGMRKLGARTRTEAAALLLDQVNR